MAAELLPEDLWNEIEPLLPPPLPPSPKGGRPPVCNKAALKGIIFLLRSGVAWQMLPTEAFHVSGSSCWRRFTEWTAAGIWPKVHQRLLNRLGKLDGIDLQRVVVDSQSVRALKRGRTRVRTRRIAGKRAASVTS
jgi:transposase